MSMISRQVAELREWSEHENLVEEDRMMADLLFKAADTIEMLSEKVREPRHGEWVINNNGWAYCSECESLGLESYNFCPYCGVKMVDKDTDVPNKLPMSAKHEAE